MTKQWNSPVELNTFTTEQGRKLLRTKLSNIQADRFVSRFVETAVAAREAVLNKSKAEIGKILVAGYCRDVGLLPEYVNSLPRGLLPILSCFEVNSNAAGKILDRTYTVIIKLDNQPVPYNLYSRHRCGIYSDSIPKSLTEPELARLRELLTECCQFHADRNELSNVVNTKVRACKKIPDLLKEFPTAESYLDDKFYEGEPNTPAIAVPEDTYQAILGKFAVAA